MNPVSVMLVDDNANFLRAVTQFLEAHDDVSVVATAERGDEALELVENVCPEVILVDLAMPGMPGIKAIPLLRERLPGAVIVALTVMSAQGFRKSALSAGADDFISKSKMRHKLVPTIRKLVGENGHGQDERVEEEISSTADEAGDPIAARRVLLLEDESYQRNLYTRVLDSGGYVVEEATTLEEARALLEESSFGVFLSDIHIGRDRATDLVKEQQERLAMNGTQVVVLSADHRYRTLCDDLGVQIYLEKPVSLAHLVQLLDRLTGNQ